MSTKPPERVGVCGVRSKYAKPDKDTQHSPYSLYTTYSKPGLLSIFFNEDQRCFHNWGLEAGSGNKRGRIREAIDHQINAPVMEIVGPHDGTVYMVCPPQPNSTMHIDMPYVTILMRDMHGYSSVEFMVLDSLGFSRKICAKNFKSRCTIGELNLEIPMRLSPTWNFACVNLDDALHNAFGTRLSSVQRIKINAYARVRRVYFSEEIFSYKSLPQEFRIKLSLTPQEKVEIQMFDEFFSGENAFQSSPEQRVPWALPKLLLGNKELQPLLNARYSVNLQGIIHKKVDILEVPAAENEPEKYDDVNMPNLDMSSNAALLRELLQKSIPPSKILLPTLSLIYPDQHAQNESDEIRASKITEYLKKRGGGGKETGFFGRVAGTCEDDNETLLRLRKCFELDGHYSGEEGEDDKPATDWEKINRSHHGHHHSHERHSHGHHHHNACKHNAKVLAKYLKQREVLGSYDLFNGTVKNPKFFEFGQGDVEDLDGDNEEETPPESETLPELTDSERKPIASHSHSHGHGHHAHHSHLNFLPSTSALPSLRSSRMNLNRKSTVSHGDLQNPSALLDDDGEVAKDLSEESMDSWILSWAYTGVSWFQTRQINQKLLNDAWIYYSNENKRKSMLESSLTTHQNAKLKEFYKVQQQHQKKFLSGYSAAVPMLPKMRFLKDHLEGSYGHYDVVFDNPSMPIEYF